MSEKSISAMMEELSTYIAGALERPLPEDVVEKAKHHLLDTMAAVVSGSQLRPGKMAIAYVQRLGGTPVCTVVGAGFLTNPVNAALANGMHAHADETDDSHFRGRYHPGCGIVPGAFAAAELMGSSGTDLLRALVLGYDIGTRFNLSMGQSGAYAGGHSTHTIGTLFGASAAAGALMRHDPRQIRHQLSYSVQQGCGVPYWARDEEHIEKAFDFGGLGARNALAAATMVAEGMTGVDDALSGASNFFTAFSSSPLPGELTDGLGVRYEIMDATIKKWCVGSPIQGALDAITALMREHGIGPADVEAIAAELPDDRAQVVDNRDMPNISLQHLLAITLFDGGLSFESAHDYGRMSDPEIRALRAKIKVVPSAELSAARPPRQVILKVTTADGRQLVHHTKAVKGTPANPMNSREVAEKATELMAPILGAQRTRDLVDTLLSAERIVNVLDLRPLLQIDAAKPAADQVGSTAGVGP